MGVWPATKIWNEDGVNLSPWNRPPNLGLVGEGETPPSWGFLLFWHACKNLENGHK